MNISKLSEKCQKCPYASICDENLKMACVYMASPEPYARSASMPAANSAPAEMLVERVCKTAIGKWGSRLQLIVAIEEMSELTKEICKFNRGKADISAIAEEIADVSIMLEQLKIIFGCADKVEEYIDYKIKRLSERIGE